MPSSAVGVLNRLRPKKRIGIVLLTLLALVGLAGAFMIFSAHVSEAAVATGDGNWSWQNPLPQGNDLNAITCSDPTTCIAVGKNGTLLTYNGANWYGFAPAPLNFDFSGVACPGPTRCFAVNNRTSTTTVIASYDGASWITSTIAFPSFSYTVVGVTCTSLTHCLAVGQSGSIALYDGTNWTAVTGSSGNAGRPASPTTGYLYSISCPTASFCAAVGAPANSGGPSTIIFSNDGGTTWTNYGAAPSAGVLYGVSCLSASQCFAVGFSGAIVVYNGTSWTSLANPPTTQTLLSISCLSTTNRCYAVGIGGTILIYDGTNWTALANSPTTANLNGISCSAANSCLAVGGGGVLVNYDGTNWTKTSSSLLSDKLNAVSCANLTFCVGLSDIGNAVYYTGTTLTNGPTANGGNSLRAVSCPATGFCVGTGVSGNIELYNGSSWTLTNTTPTALTVIFTGVSCSDTTHCVAVGTIPATSNYPAVATYDGTSWSVVNQTATSQFTSLRAVSCVPSGTFCVATGDSKNIITSNDRGATWTAATITGAGSSFFNGLGVSCVSASACYVATSDGSIIKYDGTSWTYQNIVSFQQFNSISCPVAGTCYLVGNSGLAYTYSGNTATAITGFAVTLRGISCLVGTGVCLAVGDNGTIVARGLVPLQPVPALTSLNPGSVAAGSATFQLTVNGSNFTADSTVRFNGYNRLTTFISSTQLSAQINAADVANSGTASVSVYNPNGGGGLSASLPFTITGQSDNPVPSSTTLLPNNTLAGSPAFTLTVNGSNFVANSVVRYNGSDRPTTFVSASQLTAAISASDISAAGSYPVTVFNPAPGGGLSNVVTFTVNSLPTNPVPTLSAISPITVTAGGPSFTLALTGTNFSTTSVVRYNGSDRPTGFISSTSLTATISASDISAAGSYSVTVFNPAPGGGLSNSLTLTVVSATNPCPQPLVVSQTSGTACGSLPYALDYANTNVSAATPLTITFALGPTSSAPYTFTLASRPTLNQGVNLDAANYCTAGPGVVLRPAAGVGPVAGLQLSGNNLVRGIWVRGFSGPQLVTTGGGNRLSCFRTSAS